MQKTSKSKIQNPKSSLRLGTRASPLALIQARSIARMLKRAHTGLRVKLVEITTTGDRVRRTPLREFGGTGVFVKELESALLQQRIDLAVHSLKDLPTRQPRGLAIGAIVGREDTRDVVVLRGARTLADLPPGSLIGTGSPRRKAQLMVCYPHLAFAEIRGNVETRLRKVREGRYAGTILARAGLKRLGLLARGMQTLPHALMLPAPGQGALAIECRTGDRRVRRFLQTIHNEAVCACVTAERSVLQTLGGGCHLPLGALGEIRAAGSHSDGALHLSAVLGLPDGTASVRAESFMPLSGGGMQARELGRRVGRAILAQGGSELLERLGM